VASPDGMELALDLPPGGLVEPCVALKAELAKRARGLEMTLTQP